MSAATGKPRHALRAATALAALLALVPACGDDATVSARRDAGDGPGGKAHDGGGSSHEDGGDRDGASDTPDGSGSSHQDSGPQDAASEPGSDGSAAGPGGVDCDGPADTLPDELACTGLYADIADKTIADGVREFEPAYALWSDGAQKTRWIYLPEGTAIDGSDATEWKFPIGTKLWKEFRWKGRRAETRLFWKVGETRWLKTAYRWEADESGARRFAGGIVPVGANKDDYYIPSPKECDQCHKGRTDRVLGFEAGLLGLPGAQGLTLAKLVDEGLLEHNEVPVERTLGDDGTGVGAEALGWLHVNCGVSCHNANLASEAYKTDLRFRLSASELDGSSLENADARTTAIDVMAKTPRWSDRKLVVPGQIGQSLLYQLISQRDPAQMRDQMPPIASRRVDDEGVQTIKNWITALGASEP